MARTNEHGYVGAKPLTSTSQNTGVFTPHEKNVLDQQGKLKEPGNTSIIDLVVVAGGGGGGRGTGYGGGAGGGAGGFRQDLTKTVARGTTITCTIGTGGATGFNSSAGNASSWDTNGTAYEATGGGRVHAYNPGVSGGSGGGGSHDGNGNCVAGGAGNAGGYSPSEGSSGGSSGAANNAGGGGGGGAGSTGSGCGTSDNGRAGGSGKEVVMTGASLFFSEGGGAGGGPNSNAGGSGRNNAGSGGYGSSSSTWEGNAATANFGGGGGGGRATDKSGGAGASGRILFKVAKSDKPVSTTGSPTITEVGDNLVYDFTGTGTVTF